MLMTLKSLGLDIFTKFQILIFLSYTLNLNDHFSLASYHMQNKIQSPHSSLQKPIKSYIIWFLLNSSTKSLTLALATLAFLVVLKHILNLLPSQDIYRSCFLHLECSFQSKPLLVQIQFKCQLFRKAFPEHSVQSSHQSFSSISREQRNELIVRLLWEFRQKLITILIRWELRVVLNIMNFDMLVC